MYVNILPDTDADPILYLVLAKVIRFIFFRGKTYHYQLPSLIVHRRKYISDRLYCSREFYPSYPFSAEKTSVNIGRGNKKPQNYNMILE